MEEKEVDVSKDIHAEVSSFMCWIVAFAGRCWFSGRFMMICAIASSAGLSHLLVEADINSRFGFVIRLR